MDLDLKYTKVELSARNDDGYEYREIINVSGTKTFNELTLKHWNGTHAFVRVQAGVIAHLRADAWFYGNWRRETCLDLENRFRKLIDENKKLVFELKKNESKIPRSH